MRVFVGYASTHGSTRGIAERIAAGLRGHGHDVVLGPMRPGVDVEGFDAAVLGSAVHGGRWLPEAVEFTRRNAGPPAGLRVWLFSVSLLGERSTAFRPGVTRRLRALRAKHSPEQPTGVREFVAPQGHHDFAGAVEPENWSFLGRLVFRLMGGRYGDHRAWAEIDGWAETIARGLASTDVPGRAPPPH